MAQVRNIYEVDQMLFNTKYIHRIEIVTDPPLVDLPKEVRWDLLATDVCWNKTERQKFAKP